MIVVAAVAALLAVLVIADRVTVSYVQGRVAGRFAGRGFGARPQVAITGFPFLTQLAARRLRKVTVSGPGKKLGPVEVRQLDLILHGMRANHGRGGSTAARLSGTALVGFAGLAGIAGTPGLTLRAGGPGQVTITVALGPLTATATARVSRAGPGGIRIGVISAGGIPLVALGSLRDITLPLPGLPQGVTVQHVSVTGQGILVHVAGQNVSFGIT